MHAETTLHWVISCVSHTFERLVASSHDSTLSAIFNISPEHALEHLFMCSFFFTHRTILDFSFSFPLFSLALRLLLLLPSFIPLVGVSKVSYKFFWVWDYFLTHKSQAIIKPWAELSKITSTPCPTLSGRGQDAFTSCGTTAPTIASINPIQRPSLHRGI